MTNTVTINDKNIATVDITIDAKTAKEAYERAIKAFGANVNIAGFRKGKAPSNIVEKYVGEDRLKAEVIDRLFPMEFQKAIDDNKLNIAFRPALEKYEINVGEELKMTATVELKPEVKIGAFKDVEVEYTEYKNEENAIDNELAQTQKRFSTLEKFDRASKDKDTVVFDFYVYV